MYPDHKPFETVWKDGGVVEYIKNTFGARGFLDGRLFTKAVLSKLDHKAWKGLENWLAKPGNALPADVPVPSKHEGSKQLVADWTPEALKAARAADEHLRRRGKGLQGDD
jgi:hypothetical protein